MASDRAVAKLLAHIAACRTAELPGKRLYFRAGGRPVGYVKPDFAARLTGVRRRGNHVELVDCADLNEVARAAGCRWRDEDFDVRELVDGPVLAVLDRGALPDFGVIGVGVHVNGLVEDGGGWRLWVGKRAADKKLDPGKLDHLVAGGVPAGLTRWETLTKEGAEEAGIPAALMAGAAEVARFDYAMERPEGLRRDVVFAYDLRLPPGFLPEAVDGEVAGFELWPLGRVLEALVETADFKFNVTLVLIDLLIRKGLVAGDAANVLRAALNETPRLV
jgi:hypothetical protein